MILTITLNPAIDKSTSVEKIIPDSKLRCAAVKNEAGGGGINVSKALTKLGAETIALFPAGGNIGKLLQDLLKEVNVPMHIIDTGNETRENFIVLETSSGKQFRFNVPGEKVRINVLEEIIAYIKANKFEYIIASGSILPGLPDDAYAQIGEVAKQAGAKYILDTSGEALRLAVQKGVYLLKPNIGELAMLSQIKWLETDKVEATARKLINNGWAEIIAVSMGRDGAILINKENAITIKAPEVKRQSTVGAGDSMLAGIVYMLSKGKALKEIASFGVACGSAATMNPGTELFKKADAELLYDQLLKQ